MSSFFRELKRRNVYKVVIAYAVVAWLLIQLASILFPIEPNSGNLLVQLAEIHLAQGDTAEAGRLLARVPLDGRDPLLVNPSWNPLRGDPRFQELAEAKK